jgi:hypothetical protein
MVLTRAQKSGKEPLVKIPKKIRKKNRMCAEAQNVCVQVQNVCVEVQNLSLCSDPKGSIPQKGQLQPNASILINQPELVNFLLSEELPEETSMRSIRYEEPISLLTSIMCVKDIIAKKTLIKENP